MLQREGGGTAREPPLPPEGTRTNSESGRRGRGRQRSACAACREAKRKCDGAQPCGRCMDYNLACEPWVLDASRACKRPLTVSGAENGAAGERGAPASQAVRLPPMSAGQHGAPPGSMDNERVVAIGGSTYDYGLGGGERTGLVTTLDMGPWVLSYTPQVSDSIPASPMRSVGCEEGGGGLVHGVVSTWDGYGETWVPPRVQTDPGVGRERAPYMLRPDPPPQHSAGRDHEEEKDRRSRPRGALEGAMRGCRRDVATLGSGAILVETGGSNVERPIGAKDNIEVAFSVTCCVTAELELEGKLNLPHTKFVLIGLEFGFLVMGSGFAYPLFLDTLRQCLNRAGPRADSAYTSASASIATSFLVHHIMAVADPHYRPPSSSSSSVCTRGSQLPCHPSYAREHWSRQPGHCAQECDPLAPPPLHCHDSQQAVRGLVDLPGARQSAPFVDPPAGSSLLCAQQEQQQERVAGLNGTLHMASHGTSYDAGLVGPRGMTPEVAWINELWDDPHAAACSFSMVEVDRQPLLRLPQARTNAFMAREFVSGGELINMSTQLKTMAPMLLSRFMTRESATHFYRLLGCTISYGNDERTCFVEMVNRRGQLVKCLAIMRWDRGRQHSIIAVRFTPFASLSTSPSALASVSSSTTDMIHRRGVSSVVPTGQSLARSAAPQPIPPPSMAGQDSLPLYSTLPPPSPPRLAWQGLPMARLGGSGDEAGRVALHGFQPPTPPIPPVAFLAQAGPRSSTMAQAAVAVDDVACSFATSPVPALGLPASYGLSPLPSSALSGLANELSLNDEEMQWLLDAVD